MLQEEPLSPTSSSQSILVRGGGLAGACAAHLLRAHGFAIAHEPVRRSPVPVIMLSDAALGLIRDAFGRQDLFAQHHRITTRVVRWGGDAVTMPHGAVVVSENDLISALGGELVADVDVAAPIMALHCAPPFPEENLMRFGQAGHGGARLASRRGRSCLLPCRGCGAGLAVSDPFGAEGLLAAGRWRAARKIARRQRFGGSANCRIGGKFARI
jgi:hypothetical protein